MKHRQPRSEAPEWVHRCSSPQVAEIWGALIKREPRIPDSPVACYRAVVRPNLLHRIIVVGTGTAVGKTRVASALTEHIRLQGQAVEALKPVETGYADNQPSDARWLGQATGRPFRAPLYQFPHPLSPHLAARLAQVLISVDAIAAWARREEGTVQIVETAGGLYSPLNEDRSNLDLIRALLPAHVVLVAPDRLGVLHDVRATYGALSAFGFDGRLHLVLSCTNLDDPSVGTNQAELGTLGYSVAAYFPHESRATANGSGLPAMTLLATLLATEPTAPT